jgi:hypothetical protein
LKPEAPAKDLPVTHWPQTVVESILSLPAGEGGGEGRLSASQNPHSAPIPKGEGTGSDTRFVVELSGQHAGTIEVDRIIANVGFRPDNRIYEELQIHECYASQGPMKLAAALLGQSGGDCLDQKLCGPGSLLHPEPNFYILGHKSYGRSPNFLFQLGLAQIREVFSIIGDRAALDLYSTAKPLLK